MAENKIIIELDAWCLMEKVIAIIQESMLEMEKRSDSGKQKLQETELMTRSEVCELLHISQPTLTKNMKNGTIRYKRVGRRVLFDKNQLFKQ